MGEPAMLFERAEESDSEERHDLRVVPRTAVNVSVDLFSEHNFWTGLTMNVSEGGVFVATYVEVPIGTRLVLHLEVPGEEQKVETVAVVRWTRAFTDERDAPPGLGLQFVDLDEASLVRIRRFIRTRDPLFFEE